MISGWELPYYGVFGGKKYPINCDYRDIIEIFSYFSDPDLPLYLQWRIALALFYQQEIPPEHYEEAMTFLSDFVSGGKNVSAPHQPKVLDWQQDSDLIVADINRVAGREIRELPFLHWWTFLSWFHAIGEGQLSTVIAIRNKLARGEKLEYWEKTYYRDNKQRVDLPKRRSQEELAHRRELENLLEKR